MNAIHVITQDNVFHHIGEVLAYGRTCRVEIPTFSVAKKPLSFTFGRQRAQGMYAVEFCSIKAPTGSKWIHPGVELHTSVVSGFDHVSQWIVQGIVECGALFTYQKTTQRHRAGAIECIASRANLYKYRIHVHRFQHIQQAVEFGFLPFGRQPWY